MADMMMKPQMPQEGEEMQEQQGGSPEFSIPDGLDIPQGDAKEFSCKIRNLGNGMACVEEVNGIPLSGAPQEQVPESMQDMPDDEGTENNFSKFMSGRKTMTRNE